MSSRHFYDNAVNRTTGQVNFNPSRIKWYVKPLIFGGDPNEKENVTWVILMKRPSGVGTGSVDANHFEGVKR